MEFKSKYPRFINKQTKQKQNNKKTAENPRKQAWKKARLIKKKKKSSLYFSVGETECHVLNGKIEMRSESTS